MPDYSCSCKTLWEEDLGLLHLSSKLDLELWPLLRDAFRAFLQKCVAEEANELAEEVLARSTELDLRSADLEAREGALLASQRELEAAQEAVAAGRLKLEQEKQRMAAGTSRDDVLSLNIGGEKTVAVQRSTLCIVSNSMLASSFSGRWDKALSRHGDGSFFVDMDPALFMPLLSYLRVKSMEPPGSSLALPSVPGREGEFAAMLAYYGLDSLCTRKQLEFKFLPAEGRQAGIEIVTSVFGMVVARSSESHWLRSFGSQSTGLAQMLAPVRFKLQIEVLGYNSPTSRNGNDGGPINGPTLGLADSDLRARTMGSDWRDSSDAVWVFRARDGMLLAPNPQDVVGPNPRTPAAAGDTITFAVHRDGTVAMALNDDDFGIIFCNVTAVFWKPIVEMNSRGCRVRILQP